MTGPGPAYSFRVFVSARQADLSDTAVTRLRLLCRSRLHGRYEVEVVDVEERPDLAEEERIVVVPTVIRDAPFPQRRVMGDLSDDVRTAAALGFPDPQEASYGRGGGDDRR